jgi:hypothetical protein
VQKSYQNSTSPNLVRNNSSNKVGLKKQSSFLIEKNKSMLDLSVEVPGGDIDLSENDTKGSFLGGSNQRMTSSMRFTKQKSS